MKKIRVYSSFRDIWGTDLADMQSLSKYNKGIKYLLYAIDIFSKYTWAVHLKDKKGTSIVNAFQKIISEGRKPNKVWIGQDGEFYNNLFLKINNTEMYSTYYEEKSVIAERFIRMLKSKIFKQMRIVSKNVYFDVLDDIADKYKNIFAEEYMTNFGSEEVFIISKIKDTVPWTYRISDLNGESITGSFFKKNFKKEIEKNSE